MELVAGIHMVSVLVDEEDDDDDRVLADDDNFSLVLSLFSICRWTSQGKSPCCKRSTLTTQSSRRSEAERTGSHISRDGEGGYKVDLQWHDDAFKVRKHLSPFDKESSS